MRKYEVILTEEQLMLIANCVEDCHRFCGGQMELFHTTSISPNYIDIVKKLEDVKPLMTPNLSRNECYGWNGGSCEDDNQRKFLAKTYAIYREILHQLQITKPKKDIYDYNVYDGETLTCKEGGELPIIKLID